MWLFMFGIITPYGVLRKYLGTFHDMNPKTLTQKNWLFNYGEKGKFNFSLPILPATEIEEIDLWFQRVWQVWANVIIECRKYSPDRDDLRKYAETRQKEKSEMEKEEQEIPDFKKWDPWTLFILDSDR